jgi:hypothetical protein
VKLSSTRMGSSLGRGHISTDRMRDDGMGRGAKYGTQKKTEQARQPCPAGRHPCSVFPRYASSRFTHLYISPRPTLRFGLRYILDTFSANDLSADISARNQNPSARSRIPPRPAHPVDTPPPSRR